MATTPLEREILTHYSTADGPYRGGAQNWTPIHAQIVRRFIDLGLLIADPGTDGAPRVRANEEALKVYLAALAAVPLPLQRWVVPGPPGGERTAGIEGPAVRDDTAARLAALEHQVRALQSEPVTPRRPGYDGEED